MKHILLIGAGRSATTLIDYLLEQAERLDWFIRLGDRDETLAQEKIKGSSRATAFGMDVKNTEQLIIEIRQADVVISMLPAFMHLQVAELCVEYRKHLVTASYVSEDMKKLNEKAEQNGVLLLNEIGLDPGIDHMSAMKLIHHIKDEGHKIEAFESFTGGLLAPESEKGNPWKYKFTWNPRNVVLAGQGGSVKFLHNGRHKYIPPYRLFRRTEILDIEGFGKFEGYANRDSLSYINIYGLQGTPTVYRGTLRRVGFCRAWHIFVMLGATDDSYVMEDIKDMTYREFINSFLPYNPNDSVELKLMQYLHIDQDSDIMEKLRWSGIFSDKRIGLESATPAQILEKILMDKWKMDSDDRDMIAMLHKLIYFDGVSYRKILSHMVIEGKDSIHTGMAQTVGLPVGVATKLILEGVIREKGVQIPVKPEIYEPVLKELEHYGIQFIEQDEICEIEAERTI
ncbi:saccharopine dehydrogenase family protein [Sediminitomix flava]|uniref:Saccharopine dehydrogenase (NAD+, L-glutamate forming) n=1 Tax=Sediminitomix flava TaxID=379075 RepID=A0A315YXJ2_SEDFL|nr:saccharopine dehydrogenase C-terminal domain-containing protein [Sediminitomix flava]PWJ34197.1 saccharopine dehydrogenase (NAD+, L-glutamate forming) [Sediminitomix flava]